MANSPRKLEKKNTKSSIFSRLLWGMRAFRLPAQAWRGLAQWPARSADGRELWTLFQAKRFGEMEQWFQRVHTQGLHANLDSWNLLLRKAEIERNADSAVKVFRDMRAQNVEPDAASFRFLLNTLADAGRGDLVDEYLPLLLQMDARPAESREISSLFARLIARRMRGETVESHRNRSERHVKALRDLGIQPSASVWGALIRIRVADAARRGDTDSVIEQSLSEPHVNKNAVLRDGLVALVGAGFPLAAWKHLNGSLLASVIELCRTDQVLLRALIRSAPSSEQVLTLWSGLDDATRVSTQQWFLDALLRTRLHWEKALQALGLENSLDDIVRLMNHLVKCRQSETALEVWEYLSAHPQLKPNRAAFLAALPACAVRMPRGNCRLDARFVDVLRALEASSLPPDEELLIAILQTQGKCGDSASVLAFLRAISEGKLGAFRMTNSLLEGIVNALSADQFGSYFVPELLNVARSEWQVSLTASLYNNWIRALQFRPDSTVALRLYEEMKKKNIQPTAATYNGLFRVLDQDPNITSNEKQLHYLLHDWNRVSKMRGKDALTNNLILKALRNRPTSRSETIFWRILRFMSASEDPAQWPTSDTYHIVVRGLVRRRDFKKALHFVEATGVRLQDKRKRGLRPEGFWNHTIEYLLGHLLGEGELELANKLREWAQHNHVPLGPDNISIADVDDD